MMHLSRGFPRSLQVEWKTLPLALWGSPRSSNYWRYAAESLPSPVKTASNALSRGQAASSPSSGCSKYLVSMQLRRLTGGASGRPGAARRARPG